MKIDFIPANLVLGECPIWDKLNKRLIFIDIVDKKILFFADEKLDKLPLKFRPGCISLNSRNELMCGGESSIFSINFYNNSMNITEIFRISQPAYNRINDGKHDSYDNFWFATMDDTQCNQSGKLYMLTPDLQLYEMYSNFIIGNGLDWSNCGKFIYFTDSIRRVIYRFEINYCLKKLYNKKIFIKISDLEGEPDGLVIDSSDNLWSAHWNAGLISVYSNLGERIEKIYLPAQHPTSLCFIDDSKYNLFVTTALVKDRNIITSENNLDGGLLRINLKK